MFYFFFDFFKKGNIYFIKDFLFFIFINHFYGTVDVDQIGVHEDE